MPTALQPQLSSMTTHDCTNPFHPLLAGITDLNINCRLSPKLTAHCQPQIIRPANSNHPSSTHFLRRGDGKYANGSSTLHDDRITKAKTTR